MMEFDYARNDRAKKIIAERCKEEGLDPENVMNFLHCVRFDLDGRGITDWLLCAARHAVNDAGRERAERKTLKSARATEAHRAKRLKIV